MSDEAKCPFPGVSANQAVGTSANDWWPNQIKVDPLLTHSEKSDPMDAGFDYATEFAKLDLGALKADIATLMKTSQDWWPAD